MPSAKYALALSSLRFSNGSTAMLFSGRNAAPAIPPEALCAIGGEPRRKRIEKPVAKAIADISKVAISANLGQRGALTGRIAPVDACFHLLPRLSFSGRCGLP